MIQILKHNSKYPFQIPILSNSVQHFQGLPAMVLYERYSKFSEESYLGFLPQKGSNALCPWYCDFEIGGVQRNDVLF